MVSFFVAEQCLSYYDLCVTFELSLGAEEQFTVPPNTIQVISEAVFIASHLTGTDAYMKIHKLNTTQKPNNTKYRKKNRTTLVQSPLATLGQESR